jgi:CelD/BcsL family acetyltransferase involved in cellulose biosynthesis
VHVTVLKAIPEDPELCGAWNNLVLGMENPEVFFTHQWALAVTRGFREKQSPLLFLMHDSGQLAGVAVLAVDSGTPRAASFLASSTADYCDIVSAPENRGAVLLALLRKLQNLGFRDLIMASIPATSATLTHLDSAARTSGFYIATRASSECGIVELGDERQRKALVQAVAAKNREKRGLKKLSALGSVGVVHLREPLHVQATLDAIMSAQISRFLASGRVSPLLDPERRAFLAELGNLLAQAGWLKISQLEVNGRSIAWNYGFCFEGSWFWYLPAFQIEHDHSSPGSCLLRLLVEEACGDPALRWLDLGLGDESYKVRFANNARQTRYVQLSRSFLKHVAKVGRQKLAATLARSPYLESRIRGARDRYRHLVSRSHDTGLVATARHFVRRAMRPVASRSEVLIFQACGKETEDDLVDRVVPMRSEHLVQASIRSAGDPQTLGYLMRCAQRMSQPGVSGFVSQDEAGRSTHFLWITGYDGFRISEIDHRLDPISQDADVIFDCWTPAVDRGHGYYAIAVRSAAARLRREGKTAWIFSDANNVPSVRGIQKAGFAYRFSLVRRCRLGHSTVVRHEATAAI